MSTTTIHSSAGITVARATSGRSQAARARSLRGLVGSALHAGVITSPFVEQSGDLSRPDRFWTTRR